MPSKAVAFCQVEPTARWIAIKGLSWAGMLLKGAEASQPKTHRFKEETLGNRRQ